MLLLDNPVQTYDWGAVDGLVDLVGVPPSGGPQAELWIGTHPVAPSHLAGQPTTTLAAAIAEDPAAALGPALAEAVGPRLPFLLKVLAIGASLSVQAHPSAAQAREGYARGGGGGRPARRTRTAPTATRTRSPSCSWRSSTRGRCAGSASRPRR